MNESTSNQLNECDLDNSSDTYQFDETSCVVDEKFVPKVGMVFKTLEKTGKFYKHYSKLVNFSTKIRNTTRDGDKIKNQLIVCTRKGRWKSKISPTLKTNPSAGLRCSNNTGSLTCLCRTIETHEEAGIRPSKTYQSFVAAAGSHRKLGFIEKDVRNYITREVWNISEEDDAKEFGKYLKLDRFPQKVRPRRQQVIFSMHCFRFITPYGFELYEDRHIWIPVYLDHHFWAVMKSTQRSESMHLFFNKFITRTSSLRQFVKQYDNCLASRERIRCCRFSHRDTVRKKTAIEAQFQHVYTHEKFREVQAQFRGKVNCITRSMHSTLGCTTYEVIEHVCNSTFNKGILCRHSLSVLSFERVDNVAPKYILECWSKNIKRRHTHIKSSQDEPLLEPKSKRFDELVFRSHNICEFASESEELTEILHRVFDKVMAEMKEYQERSKGKSLLTHKEATLSNVNDFQSSPRVKTRGRPKNRLGSNLEKKI
ncbi:hypothetical protein Ahy_B06g079971 [Arachis hypogaea]|uniref:Protein FAR1-RELATED SEQUENCE n=1 Tax=Arachis hypogaea TaxID=3818 RepID=A0A444YGT0_ARAHY|nr:hypothetical protein Ahy_B06g079971 [Arachis hypogaea]